MFKGQNGQVKVVVLSVWLSCHEPLGVLVLYDTTQPNLNKKTPQLSKSNQIQFISQKGPL